MPAQHHCPTTPCSRPILLLAHEAKHQWTPKYRDGFNPGTMDGSRGWENISSSQGLGAERKAERRLPTLPARAPGPRAHTGTGWEHSRGCVRVCVCVCADEAEQLSNQLLDFYCSLAYHSSTQARAARSHGRGQKKTDSGLEQMPSVVARIPGWPSHSRPWLPLLGQLRGQITGAMRGVTASTSTLRGQLVSGVAPGGQGKT